MSFYRTLRITTAACACPCPSHRRRGDRTFAAPRCAVRIPASRAGDLCPACAAEHLECGRAGACTHRPIWRP